MINFENTYDAGRRAAIEIASHELADDRSGRNETAVREWLDQEAQAVLWNTSDDAVYNAGYFAGLHEIGRNLAGTDPMTALDEFFNEEVM